MTHGIAPVADINNGEGKLRITDEWKALPAFTRADILRDWMEAVEVEYDATLRELADKFERSRAKR